MSEGRLINTLIVPGITDCMGDGSRKLLAQEDGGLVIEQMFAGQRHPEYIRLTPGEVLMIRERTVLSSTTKTCKLPCADCGKLLAFGTEYYTHVCGTKP